MILKRNFNPLKVVQYVQTEMITATLISVVVYALHKYNLFQITLPFTISGILGSALAIFIAFRNNSSYSRWWEAKTLWASIINNSRIFARQIIANADNAIVIGKSTPEKVSAYKKEMVYRQITFAHTLRLHLRKQTDIDEFKHLLLEDEFSKLKSKINPPNILLLQQGVRVKEGIKDEILGAFDNISIEPTLAGFNNFQGACERIKNTPLLRQYDYYTRIFLYVFTVMLPFSLIGDFTKLGIDFMMIPISIIVTFVFASIGKVGEVNEDPFENKITDIPMTAMCNTIERDLKEMLGEAELPTKLEPEKGFLF